MVPDVSRKFGAFFLDYLTPEDKGAAFLGNVGNHSPKATASYVKRPESSLHAPAALYSGKSAGTH
jgi:hypothetical protein